MITSATAFGWETMITCEPSSSVMSAPARSAIERVTSAPAAVSPVATTAHEGFDFQAGGAELSAKPAPPARRWARAHARARRRRQAGRKRVVELRGVDRNPGRRPAVLRILER